MNLVLARHLDDPAALLAELQEGWRRGALIGLTLPQERAALQQAVLGGAEGERSSAESRAVVSAGSRVAAGRKVAGGGITAGRASEPGSAWESAAELQACAAPDDPADPARAGALGPPWDESTAHTAPAAISQGPGVVLGSGGSSGGRRWCLQPLEHLWASADACGLWLSEQGLEPAACLHLNALPLQHVSGLMPLLRAQRWGAELRWLPPDLMRRPSDLAAAAPLPPGRPVLLSLVPTQLHRLLESPEAMGWLAGCRVIWVGGAALAVDLAERARGAGLPLAPCYGATETAAMVCALPPQRFLAGEGGCGAPLADVELRLEGAAGAVEVRTARLSPGWFSAGRLQRFAAADGWWRSGDGGRWSPSAGRLAPEAPAAGQAAAGSGSTGQPEPPSRSLVIHGRLDGALHSGGETVFPEQLEQRLRQQAALQNLPLQAVLLLGLPDRRWGERLVALVRPADGASPERLLSGLETLTASWPAAERPRLWQLCPALAPSAAGKWERARWRHWLLQHQPHIQAGTSSNQPD